jgi:hypothetical protein
MCGTNQLLDNDFMNLTSIDLSFLSKVEIIGDNLLYNCSKLTEIDLTPLNKTYHDWLKLSE